MTSEVLQFAAVIAAALVALVAWLAVIYLPRRTMEHRYDSEDGEKSKATEETSPSGNDRTR